MSAEPRSQSRSVQAVLEGPMPACTRCPVCGSEECLILEELGTYCSTMIAATFANLKEVAEKPD